MTESTLVSGSDFIDKRLFEAGMQCAKRLYLDFHERHRGLALSPRRQELAEIGARLVELAAQAFPRGTDLGELDFDEAAARTAELLGSGQPCILFHSAFRGGGAEARVDIVLSSVPGEVDLFEVKAGTTVKPRHVFDVALQIHAIEAAGHRVKSASILHLDPKFEHQGGKSYPVHKLFRNVDVSERARKAVARVAEQIDSFRLIVEDEGSLELPMGTWCTSPLPCHYIPRCLSEGPPHPLFELPQLNPRQEARLHEQAIEDIGDIDPAQPGLTVRQRRAIRAIQTNELIVEPFVAQELADVDWPVSFLHVGWHMEVLPRFERSRPWQKLPYMWSIHELHEDGTVQCRHFVAAEPVDPREETIRRLREALENTGTMVVYGHGLDERLRALIDDRAELKANLRMLLQLPLLELGNLLQHGIYHPDFRGRFDVDVVERTLTATRGDRIPGDIEGWVEPETLEVSDDEAATEAYRRLLNTRTRAATREKLAAQLATHARARSAQLLRIYKALA